MRKKIISLLCAGAMFAGACVGAVGCGSGNDGDVHAGCDITVWVSTTSGVKNITEGQIKRFIKANPQYKNYKVTVDAMGEDKAATNMITDVNTGADIFCFSQDQTVRLMRARALSELGRGATKTVTENNDEGSVQAATVGNAVYAYPLTSDNGYFLYYDKSIVKTNIGSLEAIIEDCSNAEGKFFTMATEASAFYLASFFIGTGCHTGWTLSGDGKQFVAFDDDWNSDQGVIALKKAVELKKNNKVVDANDGIMYQTSAAAISGTWDYNAAKKAYGTNFAVAKLPKFIGADGEEYQMGSFNGYKLMGVKPHEDGKVQSFCQQLALYLSGEVCQMDRFNEFNWGPSNLNAQQDERVKTNEALMALAEQNEAGGQLQGQVHDQWWALAAATVTECVTKEGALTDADYRAALKKYEDECKALIGVDLTEE